MLVMLLAGSKQHKAGFAIEIAERIGMLAISECWSFL